VHRRRRAFAAIVAVIAVVGCTSQTPLERAASLCADLSHLRATVDLLAYPPSNATVGQVRGALAKLDPTSANLEHSSLVPSRILDALDEARSSYAEILDGVGDDHDLTEAGVRAGAPGRRLLAAYSDVLDSLRCDQIRPSPV
jgi:outer membrane murein-binding lipoprotein Lpp